MRTGIAALVLLLILSSTASATGSIWGTLTLESGTSGDLAGTWVILYASLDDLLSFRPLTMRTASGAGSQVTYQILGVPPGTYYLDAWKDNNSSGLVDIGDFYGVWGTFSWPVITPAPILVIDNSTAVGSFTMYVVPEPVPTEPTSWGRIKELFRGRE